MLEERKNMASHANVAVEPCLYASVSVGPLPFVGVASVGHIATAHVGAEPLHANAPDEHTRGTTNEREYPLLHVYIATDPGLVESDMYTGFTPSTGAVSAGHVVGVDGAFVGDDVVGTVVGAALGAEVGAEVGGVGAEVGAEVGAAVGVDVVKESAAAAPLASFKVFVHSMIETWGFAATSQFTDHAVPAAAQTIVVSVPNAVADPAVPVQSVDAIGVLITPVPVNQHG